MENSKTLARLMDQAYLEVIPTRTIVDRLVHVPRRSYVSVTCSPVHGVECTLDMTGRLCALPEEYKLRVIPHIAARMVRDKGHLREILTRLDELQISSIFVPGGDAPRALGEYEDSLSLLRDMAGIGHRFEDIGVAAHPEGHPLVEEAELVRLLKEKQSLATYLVTQMCFDAQVLVNWLQKIRAADITLPAWLGLPGVAEIPKLIALSMRIGVGQSVSILKKQKGLVRKMISAKPYRPDDLIAELAPHLGDPLLDIRGFHIFSFNNVEKTEQWRQATLQKLNGFGS